MRVAGTIAAAALLSACLPYSTVDDPKPPIDVPDGFASGGENASPPDAGRWWERMNDAELTAIAEDVIGKDAEHDGVWEVVLVGDAFYEKPLADRLLPWLVRLERAGTTVLIGDPGRSYCPRERLTRLAGYDVPVTRALEDSEIKRTGVWRLRS